METMIMAIKERKINEVIWEKGWITPSGSAVAVPERWQTFSS